MVLQWSGPVLAFIVVGTIAAGHVAVRKLNYLWGTKPAVPLITLGAAILTGSLYVDSNLLCATLGIVGITTLWDGVEIIRQEKRVLVGHAPKNPNRKF